MTQKSPINTNKELETISENALITRLVLLTLVTQTRGYGTNLH